MKRLLAGSVAGVVLLVGLAGYVRVGWWRMEDGCVPSDAQRSVSYSWSWQPLGFTCTYGDGSSETSLWPGQASSASTSTS